MSGAAMNKPHVFVSHILHLFCTTSVRIMLCMSTAGGAEGFASGSAFSSGPGISFGQSVSSANGQQTVQTSYGNGSVGGGVSCSASSQDRRMM